MKIHYSKFPFIRVRKISFAIYRYMEGNWSMEVGCWNWMFDIEIEW